jgi:Helix-turn-helix domain
VSREPPELVALRRALGHQLAAARHVGEIGQQQVARKTGYSRSSVAHAEAGRQLLTRDFWQISDELLKADGALLAGYERVHAAKQEHERRTREAELAAAYAAAKADRLRHENGKASQLPGMRPLPSPDVAVAESQDAWRTVRSFLIRHGTRLAKRAAELYDPTWRLPYTPALALPSWLPSHPVPLEAVTLEWVPDPPRPVITGQEAELRPVLPLRTPRNAFLQYTSAIRYLSPPSLFENRPSYRLLDVSWTSSGQSQLQFGLTTFFDKLDVSEALSHEFAVAVMESPPPALSQLPFRALLSEPFDLSVRMAGTSIATLTLRRNTADGSCSFFMLARDPSAVVVGGGQYGVVPAGEFQPACIAPACMFADLDLWRNIVREYSEELLGEPEHDGSSGRPLDYECWPFYRAMRRARESGQLRAYVLGVVLHALSLNPAVMTAVVIDDVVFDDLFRDLVTRNAEGQVVAFLDNKQSVLGLKRS